MLFEEALSLMRKGYQIKQESWSNKYWTYDSEHEVIITHQIHPNGTQNTCRLASLGENTEVFNNNWVVNEQKVNFVSFYKAFKEVYRSDKCMMRWPQRNQARYLWDKETQSLVKEYYTPAEGGTASVLTRITVGELFGNLAFIQDIEQYDWFVSVPEKYPLGTKSFAEALQALREGKRTRRTCWEPNAFLILEDGASFFYSISDCYEPMLFNNDDFLMDDWLILN